MKPSYSPVTCGGSEATDDNVSTCRRDAPHWDQVDFRTATLHVRRVKKGTPSTHPILGDDRMDETAKARNTSKVPPPGAKP